MGRCRATGTAEVQAPGGELQAIDLLGDGKLIAATTRDGVYLWPVAGGRPAGQARDWMCRPMAVRFSPNGGLLAVGGEFRIGASLWDLKEPSWSIPSAARKAQNVSLFLYGELAFIPDGKSLAVPAEREKQAILLLDRSRARKYAASIPRLSNLVVWRSPAMVSGWPPAGDGKQSQRVGPPHWGRWDARPSATRRRSKVCSSPQTGGT